MTPAISTLRDSIIARCQSEQGGVGTFADLSLLDAIDALEAQPEGNRRMVEELAALHALPRFQEFSSRPARAHVSPFDLMASQGLFRCLTWRGLPLFKTAYDFAIYPMILHELRPASIIEIGSGTGASAVWFADLVAMQGLACEVHSFDLRPPKLDRSGVTFHRADCERTETFAPALKLPHPWLLIEDAHVNVRGVLDYFSSAVAPGDYVVVEDSQGKQDAVRAFAAGGYAVDSRYTDFFGLNATCSVNSILRRS